MLRLKTVILLLLPVLLAGGCGPRFKEAKGGAGTGQEAAGDNGATGSTVEGSAPPSPVIPMSGRPSPARSR